MDQLTQELERAIVKVREKWCEENLKDPEALVTKVREYLDRQVYTTMGKLLGFDCRYGSNWEVDHCNGRGGESVVGKFIQELVGKETANWLLDQMIPLPELTKPQLTALKKDYVSKYEEKVREKLRALIEQKAKEDAERIFNEVVTAGKVCSLSPPARETIGVSSFDGSDPI